MGIGAGILIAAVGAVLAFAVTAEVAGVDVQTIGVIMMIAGLAVALIAAIATTAAPASGVVYDYTAASRRTSVVEEAPARQRAHLTRARRGRTAGRDRPPCRPLRVLDACLLGAGGCSYCRSDYNLAASTAMRTDLYELTMVDAALRSGVADRPATFEVTARRLPPDRPHGVVAGIGRLLDAARGVPLRGRRPDLARVQRSPVAGRAPVPRPLPVPGHRRRLRRGRAVVPALAGAQRSRRRSPTPCSSRRSCCRSSTTTAPWRRPPAASSSPPAGRDLIEMGGRRTHEEAAIAALVPPSRWASPSTSNLAAARATGYRSGARPPTPSSSPSRVGAASGPPSTPRSPRWARARPSSSTPTTSPSASTTPSPPPALAGAEGPGAIRLDSDDPAVTSRRARTLLDALGARQTRIIVSGDIDENAIERLESGKGYDGERAPIDGYGVGTSVVTGGGHPTAGFVYKLVALDEPADRRGQDGRRPRKGGRAASRRGGYRASPATSWAPTPTPDRPGAGRCSSSVMADGRPPVRPVTSRPPAGTTPPCSTSSTEVPHDQSARDRRRPERLLRRRLARRRRRRGRRRRRDRAHRRHRAGYDVVVTTQDWHIDPGDALRVGRRRRPTTARRGPTIASPAPRAPSCTPTSTSR